MNGFDRGFRRGEQVRFRQPERGCSFGARARDRSCAVISTCVSSAQERRRRILLLEGQSATQPGGVRTFEAFRTRLKEGRASTTRSISITWTSALPR